MGKWPLGQKETVVIFALALAAVAVINRSPLAAMIKG